jgi:lantibiotic modifying enzyme
MEAHLREPRGDDSFFEDVDDALIQATRVGRWDREYDLISGLVGYGVYFLERMRGKTERPWVADRGLSQILEHLLRLSEATEAGTTWFTAPESMNPLARQDHPRGYYNLGLAHGVPGIIALLAGCMAKGFRSDLCGYLLESSVRWLLAQRGPCSEPSLFSYVIEPDRPRHRSRLAWCYGDPGIALALLQAARACHRDDWERQAYEIARHCLNRPHESAGIIDAGLCHGSAGLAHIYTRFYHHFRDPVFAEGARHWFRHALSFRRENQGCAGYLAWRKTRRDQPMGWDADPGFLTGAAGIGLALISAVFPIEPHWDRVLLMSHETPEGA